MWIGKPLFSLVDWSASGDMVPFSTSSALRTGGQQPKFAFEVAHGTRRAAKCDVSSSRAKRRSLRRHSIAMECRRSRGDRGSDIVRLWASSGLGAFGPHASSCCSGTAVSHRGCPRAPAMCLRRVVDIVRHHHMVANVGSGSRALCSYVCAQILIRDPDAFAPLGRHGHACPCMFCML